MPVSVKVAGAWKSAASLHTKVSGVWKAVSDMPVKIAGVWKTGILSGPAYESIATVTLGSNATSVTLSSIPTGYKDIQIRYSAKNTGAGITDAYLTINGDGGGNYNKHWIFTFDGQGPYNSTNETALSLGYTYGSDANVYVSGKIDIPDYASTSKLKTLRYFNGNEKTSGANGTSTIVWGSGLWRNTAAITSVTITSATMVAGSTFELYGIKV